MPLITDAGSLRLTAYVAVKRDDRILLVEYEPRPGGRRTGWGVPAAELDYGDDPAQQVREVLEELGLDGAASALARVDSSLRGTGWHLGIHYDVDADREPSPEAGIRRHGWFGADDLPPAEAFAHGAQARRIALTLLGADGSADEPPPRRRRVL